MILYIYKILFEYVTWRWEYKDFSFAGGVIAQADAITNTGARIEHLVKGVFSGNIFDLGVAQVLAVIVMTKEMRFLFSPFG